MFTLDLDFFPSRIPDPWAEKAPDPGSATLLLLVSKIISSLTDYNKQTGTRTVFKDARKKTA
jgi:hypothetical protein